MVNVFFHHFVLRSRFWASFFILGGILLGNAFPANAQVINQAVGGVAIDANGVIQNVQADALGALAKERREALAPLSKDIKELSTSRKISLRQIDAALREAAQSGKPLADEVKYLGGLQQIRYIFVYPEQNDIVLVGPGEGWTVDNRANVVGVSTGRPVMRLDDLMIALRSAMQAAQGGIRCSIDPSPEGVARLNKALGEIGSITDQQATSRILEEAMGKQHISLAGVPTNSHFAQVLVAADYRMKRLGMNLDKAPAGVKLPSYLQMVGSPRNVKGSPRWWMEPSYEPLLKDPSGLGWELRGAGVKTLSEEAFFSQSGERKLTGKANPIAQKWADTMTEQYASLSVAEPIFGDLRNCMELAVVSALIVKERLPQKAGNTLTNLMSDTVKTEEYVVPKEVASIASLLHKDKGWIISVSGGVAINSWGIADKSEVSQNVAPEREKAAPAKENAKWWWN